MSFLPNCARAAADLQPAQRQSAGAAVNIAWRNRVNTASFRNKQDRAQRSIGTERDHRTRIAKKTGKIAKEVEVPLRRRR